MISPKIVRHSITVQVKDISYYSHIGLFVAVSSGNCFVLVLNARQKQTVAIVFPAGVKQPRPASMNNRDLLPLVTSAPT